MPDGQLTRLGHLSKSRMPAALVGRSTAQRPGAPCPCSLPPSCASLLPFAGPAPACSPLCVLCMDPMCAPFTPALSSVLPHVEPDFNDQLPPSCPDLLHVRPSWVVLCRGGVGSRPEVTCTWSSQPLCSEIHPRPGSFRSRAHCLVSVFSGILSH